jgi:hypothetical protein
MTDEATQGIAFAETDYLSLQIWAPNASLLSSLIAESHEVRLMHSLRVPPLVTTTRVLLAEPDAYSCALQLSTLM